MERSEAQAKSTGAESRDRLQASIEEFRRRLRYIAATRTDWLRYRWGFRFEPPLRVAGTRRLPRFFFSSREVPGICAAWRLRLPEAAAAIAAQAERICQHRFDLLGYEDVACGAEIDWHCDPIHNSQAPLRPWYKLCHLQQSLNSGDAGDCRVVWELNRHQHLVTLARAYRLTGNRKFAAELILQWEQWHRQNPYPLGLNWMSSGEIARRCLSWFWVYFLLLNTPELPRGFRAQWLRGLHLSGRHMERYALRHATPGARLLAEGVALFFIGTLCPELEPADDWKRRGWNIVLAEVARLERREENRGEGNRKEDNRGEDIGFDASTCQQLHTVDLLLHASILATTNEVALPSGFETTLEKKLNILALLGRAGDPPRLGADDGGRIFDPRRNHPEHVLDPLAAGAILFGRGDFKSLAGGLREETLWLLGEAGIQEFDGLAVSPPQASSVALGSAGLFLSANAGQREQLVIDTRTRNLSGLSVSINRGGRPLIVDPGTPAEGEPSGSPVHNTVLIDWLDPIEGSGGAKQLPPARAGVDAWIAGQQFDLFAGRRAVGANGSSCEHRRWVFSLRSKFWFVYDQVAGPGVHHIGVFWHLNSEVLRHGEGAGVLARTEDSGGLRILSPENHGWREDIRQSWWSPIYGQREPVNLLQFSTISSLPAEFATLLAPVERMSASGGRLEVIPDASGLDLVRGYRYLADDYEHQIFLGRGGTWELAGWTSDAMFLYSGESQDHKQRLLIGCKTTRAEREGRRVISCSRPVERCELVITGEQMDVFTSDFDAQVSKRALDGLIPEISVEPIEEIPSKRKLKKAAGQ